MWQREWRYVMSITPKPWPPSPWGIQWPAPLFCVSNPQKNLQAWGAHTACTWPPALWDLANTHYTARVLQAQPRMLRKINEEHRAVNRVYQLKQWKWGTIDQQIYNKRNLGLVFFMIFLPEKAKERCHLRHKRVRLG